MKYFLSFLFPLFLLMALQIPAYADSEKDHNHHHHKEMIFTQAKDLISLGNPVEHTEKSIGRKLSQASLIDQNGNAFSLQNYFDKPFLLSFVFLNCPSACSAITNNLSESVRLSGDRFGKDFRVLSVSFDVENDTPKGMKEFGANFVNNFDNWSFAVGSEKSIDALVKDVGITIIKDDRKNLNHVNMLTVVDKGGIIKKHIYGDAPDPEEVWKELEKVLDK